MRRCEQPGTPGPDPAASDPASPRPATGPGPWERWPWSLTVLVPEAAAAADAGVPAGLVGHFRRPAG